MRSYTVPRGLENREVSMARYRCFSSLILVAILAALSAVILPREVRGGEPNHPPLTIIPKMADAAGVSDAAVREALARGNEFLIAQFKDGQIAQGTDVSPAFHQGLNALCVYALLNSGQAVRDPRLLPTSDF